MRTLLTIFCVAILLASSYAVHLKHTQATTLDPTEAQKPGLLKDLLDSGLQEVLAGAEKDKKIKEADDFHLDTVKSITVTPSASGTNYKFQVVCSDGKGSTLTATYTVAYIASTKYSYVSGFKYDVKTTIVTSSQPTVLGGYTPVDASELESNADLKESLDFGLDQVLGEAKRSGKLPNQTYNIYDYTSIEVQPLSNGNNYRFKIELNNGKAIIVNTTFTVNSPRKGGRVVTSSSWRATGIPK